MPGTAGREGDNPRQRGHCGRGRAASAAGLAAYPVQSIASRAWNGGGPGVNLNPRDTGRDAAPDAGRTAEAAVPKGYSDRVHQARVFPGPPGSRPARSLVYTRGGETYKASGPRNRRRAGRTRRWSGTTRSRTSSTSASGAPDRLAGGVKRGKDARRCPGPGGLPLTPAGRRAIRAGRRRWCRGRSPRSARPAPAPAQTPGTGPAQAPPGPGAAARSAP